ncbi:Crp/Fnr family transcriptional regulator [Frigoriflavimonas asaccharolytica]|uniref:CRP-like cAMP-binding protein n=1 Tax=Frigoriflavimonas asaccharolytica TaxID=2735899 RepID=A0A8J8KAR5_9FLAO|nr:cyclic nucleotide-binding domain-containing protein [Frigoriflavimonas asaccharolytica]NRS91744.1 CRP-like cAMP-binding protein [Frigoriflavimonas asaccharolytica]
MNNDIEDIFSFLKINHGFKTEDEVLFKKYFQQEVFEKNDFVLRAGEVCHKLYFVKKGLLRTFHTNQNGIEFTRLFASENEFCTILLSFSAAIKSVANIQALEKTELYSITFAHFKEFLDQSEKAKNIYTIILENFQNFQIKRLEFLTSYSSLEKVELFLNENKDLEQRISDRVISTYLQITPETYSRCKKLLIS